MLDERHSSYLPQAQSSPLDTWRQLSPQFPHTGLLACCVPFLCPPESDICVSPALSKTFRKLSRRARLCHFRFHIRSLPSAFQDEALSDRHTDTRLFRLE